MKNHLILQKGQPISLEKQVQNNLLEKEVTTRENRVWVRIAAACNVKCIFCLDSDAQNGKLIDDAKVREEIQKGFKPGMYNRIIISGGEASINPKFPEYIRYAKELGYARVQTVTNGNMFARKDFCDKVFLAGLDEVTFSLHGHTAKLHDYFTAAPGSFEKALRGLITIKKYFPAIIINIDIVVNKMNVRFLPEIVKFYMRLGVFEFDILQIIPFGRGFDQYKDELFYEIDDYLSELKETWALARFPGMYMWTNRFPAEAFEGYEDLIQDPRKIKSEVMGEAYAEFQKFIESHGVARPHCYGEACNVCFLKQYCHDFIGKRTESLDPSESKYILGTDGFDPRGKKYVILRGEEFPSDVYSKFGDTPEEFLDTVGFLDLGDDQELVNIPKCIRQDHNSGKYEWYPDVAKENTLPEYTKNYIGNFYRKKSLRCKKCTYNSSCEGIHINFIRSYGFQILKPIQDT